MIRRLSELKGRSAVIVGQGAMLKALMVSLGPVIVAFIVVAWAG